MNHSSKLRGPLILMSILFLLGQLVYGPGRSAIAVSRIPYETDIILSKIAIGVYISYILIFGIFWDYRKIATPWLTAAFIGRCVMEVYRPYALVSISAILLQPLGILALFITTFSFVLPLLILIREYRPLLQRHRTT